jgi:single-stranded DNA-binding protein
VNLVTLIGEVTSPIERVPNGEEVTFGLTVIGRRREDPQHLTVRASGAQGAACRRYLSPGYRVAIEGHVRAGPTSADIVADRVQFLTRLARVDGETATP